MESLQALFADSRSLIAAGGFVAAVIAAFVAGYVVGRAGRAAGAARPTRTTSPGAVDVRPLPEMGGDEARLMDLSGIRDGEPEPPAPVDPGHPPRRR